MGPDRENEIGDYRIASVKTGRWRQNCYVVHHRPSNDALIVDPGEEPERIIATVRSYGATPKLILLTHAHFDHVGALNGVCAEFSLPFYIHSGDLPLLRRATLYAMSFERRAITVPKTHVPVEGADLSWDGDAIAAIPTPGHTDGGVCYHVGPLCFTGDTLMKRLVGRTDLPGSSGGGLIASVAMLLDRLPPKTTLFGGHGGPWTVAEARDWWTENRKNPPEYAMEGMIR